MAPVSTAAVVSVAKIIFIANGVAVGLAVGLTAAVGASVAVKGVGEFCCAGGVKVGGRVAVAAVAGAT
jgi:hypothetical protein